MNSYNLPAVGEVRTQVKSLFLFFDSKIFTLTFIFQKTSINAAVSSFVTPTNLECFPQWTACLLLGGGNKRRFSFVFNFRTFILYPLERLMVYI